MKIYLLIEAVDFCPEKYVEDDECRQGDEEGDEVHPLGPGLQIVFKLLSRQVTPAT